MNLVCVFCPAADPHLCLHVASRLPALEHAVGGLECASEGDMGGGKGRGRRGQPGVL